MKFMPIGELRKSKKQLMELLENPPSEFNAAAIAELRELIADVEIQIQERTAGEPEIVGDLD